MKPAFGGVLIDGQGRILLRKPRDEFDGYAWTFAKGSPLPGETTKITALREVREETGYDAFITCRLPERYAGSTTISEYFLMTPIGEPLAFGPETEALAWVTPAEAEGLIGQTRNTPGRERDLKILRDLSAYQSRLLTLHDA